MLPRPRELESALPPAMALIVMLVALLGFTDAAHAEAPSVRPAGAQADVLRWKDPRQHWNLLRRELFADIELSPAQKSEVDAISERAIEDRKRYAEISRLAQRSQENDTPLEAELKREFGQLRRSILRGDHLREIEGVLEPRQADRFNRNLRMYNDRVTAGRLRRERGTQPERRP